MYITQSNIFIFYYTALLVVPPNTEMTLDLEVNEVEVKALTSLASVTGITGRRFFALLNHCSCSVDITGQDKILRT